MTTIADRDLEAEAGALAERTFGALLGALDLYLIDLGRRLGLYDSLADAPATSPQLAERTGCAERYVREWLEQQATSGILEVDDPTADPQGRVYRLPNGHRSGLLDPDSPFFVGALAQCATVLARPVPWLVDAFRSGQGIPLSAYGETFVQVQDGFTRPLYTHLLIDEWLAALPEVDARLRAQPPARVADLACGTGRAAISLARAYPQVTVDGFDNDPTSVEAATHNAAEAGVADRVRFAVHDLAGGSLPGRYDLVTVFEAVHDLARPVEALAAARDLLADDGRVIVADERTGDSFAEPGPLDGFLYAVSVLACLPQSLAEQPSAAIGTVIRPSTLATLARDAGYRSVTTLPIEHDSWRFYELTQ
jgi:2-polyprenyl-3-methyl-5-hydroxy-6-metoxy-1,4-benzoquinol methylase